MGFWPAWTLLVGYLAGRVPDEWFAEDDALTVMRSLERGGRWYREDLRIERWKGLLPEAGGVFGGFAKQSVAAGDPAVMRQFLVETRRAEYAHWGMTAGVVVTLLWNPWWAFPANAAVAAGSNLPCIAVQRYNRARLRRALDAVARRTTSW